MSRPKDHAHRFYANENFPFPSVDFLRSLGHDIITSRDAGVANKAILDDEVLETACQDNRIVLTLNQWDFVKLHNERQAQAHSGIVVCSADRDYKALAERVHEAVKQLPSLTGQLIRINRPHKESQQA